MIVYLKRLSHCAHGVEDSWRDPVSDWLHRIYSRASTLLACRGDEIRERSHRKVQPPYWIFHTVEDWREKESSTKVQASTLLQAQIFCLEAYICPRIECRILNKGIHSFILRVVQRYSRDAWLSWFYLFRTLFFVTHDLKVLLDPWRTWIINRYSWSHHSVLRDSHALCSDQSI